VKTFDKVKLTGQNLRVVSGKKDLDAKVLKELENQILSPPVGMTPTFQHKLL